MDGQDLTGAVPGAPAYKRVRVLPDDSPEDPRRWDNVGVMVCMHRRYRLGDSHCYRPGDFSGWAGLERTLKPKACAGVILPLYMMDHSGLTLATDDTMFRACDGAGWDWGMVGFIYAPKGAAAEAPKGSGRGPRLRQWLRRVLDAEVRVYSDYLNGDVWGYVSETSDDGDTWEQVDSCWGYYGDDACSGLGDELRRFKSEGYDICR